MISRTISLQCAEKARCNAEGIVHIAFICRKGCLTGIRIRKREGIYQLGYRKGAEIVRHFPFGLGTDTAHAEKRIPSERIQLPPELFLRKPVPEQEKGVEISAAAQFLEAQCPHCTAISPALVIEPVIDVQGLCQTLHIAVHTPVQGQRKQHLLIHGPEFHYLLPCYPVRRSHREQRFSHRPACLVVLRDYFLRKLHTSRDETMT